MIRRPRDGAWPLGYSPRRRASGRARECARPPRSDRPRGSARAKRSETRADMALDVMTAASHHDRARPTKSDHRRKGSNDVSHPSPELLHFARRLRHRRTPEPGRTFGHAGAGLHEHRPLHIVLSQQGQQVPRARTGSGSQRPSKGTRRAKDPRNDGVRRRWSRRRRRRGSVLRDEPLAAEVLPQRRGYLVLEHAHVLLDLASRRAAAENAGDRRVAERELDRGRLQRRAAPPSAARRCARRRHGYAAPSRPRRGALLGSRRSACARDRQGSRC
jgi:hypothetical protein